jgi:16S rRNA C967 or C1407 C5-methylase (RsmB/RsmF family)/NOL1/NOP2/fmu family ribosome biogenesis protein
METNVKLPTEFVDALRSHFSSGVVDQVIDGLNHSASSSIRLNRHKHLPESFKPHEGEAIPWAQGATLLKERPNFALDPFFHAGAYYVQDASSMMLEAVLQKLSFKRDGIALDLCAAPGGKSTILIDQLADNGFLVANEVDASRNAVLRENLLKWGRFNHAITSLEASSFYKAGAQFDLILIDAPCSGEGMFRKDPFAIEQWNSGLIASCAQTQESILSDILPTLNEGGLLVYCTCTMNTRENEAQIERLLQTGVCELALPDLSEFASYIVEAQLSNDTPCGYYLLPGISLGEGLFISVLRKSTTADEFQGKADHKLQLTDVPDGLKRGFPRPFWEHGMTWTWRDEIHFTTASAALHWGLFFKRVGLPVAQLKGKDWIPLHGLAMFGSENPGLELNKEDALRFLRKESISLRPETAVGWQMVSYQGVALGWVKVLPNRINNYYPQALRLRI